ncbi:Uncharacterized protein APZ42_015334 [Daphnia magna]|uniref:Uncharacterized protein n=1 Tax=Daphnia magna TaxID=35525 RepID=A0A0P6CJN1_9CRUS|nr:Uncharacterized protein APZ42_015334 [Daphnia magna]
MFSNQHDSNFWECINKLLSQIYIHVSISTKQMEHWPVSSIEQWDKQTNSSLQILVQLDQSGQEMNRWCF